MNSQLEIKLAPTPETDDATLVALDIECGGKFEAVHVQVSKRLERERDEWKAKYIQQNKDLGCEMMDPNGTIWDYAKKVQRERDEAREYADKLAQGLPDGMLPKDVDMLREANLGLAVELAEARGQIEANHKAALVIERMVYEARDQRDRLAAAVNAATVLIAAKGRHNTLLAYEGLRSALSPENADVDLPDTAAQDSSSKSNNPAVSG